MKNNDSKIEGIFNSYLINFRFNEKYTKYELDLKSIKKVLQDLSILLCYDLEACHDIICAKYSNLNGISYPFFKECLYNFLDKKEHKLNTMFLAEQRSIPLLDTKNFETNDLNFHNSNENVETFEDNYDLNLIILHRSLYILKKKFEKYKNEFKEIYNKYKEIITGQNILEDEILVEQNKVPKILEDIFNSGKFGLIRYDNDNFKDVIFKEMELYDKVKLDENITNDFMEFLIENRQKYNYIFTEKKLNKNFKLENYMNYIPQGEDELTKIVMETENSQKNKNSRKEKDNISEIITTNNNINEDSNEEITENHEEKEEKEEEEEEEKEEKEEKEEEKEKKEEKEQADPVQLVKKKKLKPKTILKKSPSFHSDNENMKKVQYSKSYLYIESLLLILADFISEKNRNKSCIIINYGEEYRQELRTLFDNEILGRLGEEAIYEVNKNKLDLLKDLFINKTKIEKNINNYEDLLYKMRTHNQNVDFVLITINKLKKTLDWVTQKIQNIQDNTNTFNEFENLVQIKQLKRQIKNNKKNRNMNNIINTNYQETKNINNIITESTEGGKEKNNEKNPDELSDISILKLDNKIEGMDTERLIDLNIIDASNNEENSIFLRKKGDKQLKYKKRFLPKIKTKNNLSKEEKREINIKEIFNFYSHLHSNAGHKLTFDSIRDKFEHLNLNEFLKFCNEFKILLPKEILSKIFLKKSQLTKEMSFLEFQVTLNEISIEINEEKIKQLKKRVKMYKTKGEVGLIKKCNDEINLLKQKTKEELLEEFYEYLEIDDENIYRKKMKGYELPIFYSNIYNNLNMNKVQINENKKTPIKLNSARQIYIKEMLKERKEQKKILENKLIRLNGLDREYQKRNLDINNNNLYIINNYRNKNKLEPIDKKKLNHNNKSISYKNKNGNKIINIYEKNFELDKNNINDRYAYNKKREEEARKDILKKLNLKMNDFNRNNSDNYNNINEYMFENKNNINKKQNKFTWDMLSNMKSNSLVDENELNNLIN